jgi:hypothetical protein
MKRVYLLGGLLLLIAYLWYTGRREHLTPGPPTLATLQADTQDLQKQIDSLNSQFQKMSAQAKQGADASASARAQMNLLKNS